MLAERAAKPGEQRKRIRRPWQRTQQRIFERLGLKKLISTSYAPESKTAKYSSLFAYAASQSDETPKNERGKIFVLDHDVNANGHIDFEDLEWEYLKGDGDF